MLYGGVNMVLNTVFTTPIDKFQDLEIFNFFKPGPIQFQVNLNNDT